MMIERACVMTVLNNTVYNTKSVQVIFQYRSGNKILEVVMNKESSKYGINRKLDVDENRIKILFVCHGNICRSPMAEFVLKDLVRRQRIDQNFQIDSAATSREELGNDIHRGTKAKLREVGVPFEKRCARQIDRNDYDFYDYIIVMDDENLRGLRRILGRTAKGRYINSFLLPAKTGILRIRGTPAISIRPMRTFCRD